MLKERRLEPEWMDDPAIDPGLHAGALAGLERINRFSANAAVLWPPIRELARRHPQRPLKILDIATGAGDLPVRLWKMGRRAGLAVEMDGCDRSETALEYARRNAAKAGASVRFFPLDPFVSGIPSGYDLLLCSKFFHHLDNEQAGELLRLMAGAARRRIVVNDLLRSVPGLALAFGGTRLLTRSPVVHKDASLSVRAAFTLPEVRSMAQQARLEHCRVSRSWPVRFLLVWDKPRDA